VPLTGAGTGPAPGDNPAPEDPETAAWTVT
jgi:hypothetical protein